jgi:hypothetical protein
MNLSPTSLARKGAKEERRLPSCQVHVVMIFTIHDTGPIRGENGAPKSAFIYAKVRAYNRVPVGPAHCCWGLQRAWTQSRDTHF